MGWEPPLPPVIPALWEAKAGRSLSVSSLRTAWPTWRNPISTKNIKINRVWWWAPLIPANCEGELGESLEPGRQRLQWTEISPLHSSLSNRARLSLKSRKKNKTTKSWIWWHVPIVLASQEAEVGGLLEPRRLRLQWAIITPLHSNPGDRTKPCLYKKWKITRYAW